ncbi:MAG: hypothetical protein AAF598_02475 [Bacteroidota bacterium]
MLKNIKVFLIILVFTGVFTQKHICKQLGFGQSKAHEAVDKKPTEEVVNLTDLQEQVEPPQAQPQTLDVEEVNEETIYYWDDYLMDWIVSEEQDEDFAQTVNFNVDDYPVTGPIKLDWKVLMDIKYKLRYFEEVDMEMYAPVFPKAIKALHGKDVQIEGFVIPFDETGELLSLSFNPYASCFFCGKASPASVISMYLKNKRHRYQMDDFKTFRGTLYLNEDDPDQFYYILREAREE